MAKEKAPKKTGINKGIEKGVSEEQFKDRVICKKCGKEIDFTLGSKLFLKCPRCAARVERNLKDEEKKAKKVIKWDILRRSKKAQLSFGFTVMLLAVGYNILGFFQGWFDPNWFFGLFSLPFIVLSYFCIRGTKTGSASLKYRFYARLALIVNFVALLIIIATCAPFLSDKINELLGRK